VTHGNDAKDDPYRGHEAWDPEPILGSKAPEAPHGPKVVWRRAGRVLRDREVPQQAIQVKDIEGPCRLPSYALTRPKRHPARRPWFPPNPTIA
jgi:hypothetical protein